MSMHLNLHPSGPPQTNPGYASDGEHFAWCVEDFGHRVVLVGHRTCVVWRGPHGESLRLTALGWKRLFQSRVADNRSISDIPPPLSRLRLPPNVNALRKRKRVAHVHAAIHHPVSAIWMQTDHGIKLLLIGNSGDFCTVSPNLREADGEFGDDVVRYIKHRCRNGNGPCSRPDPNVL